MRVRVPTRLVEVRVAVSPGGHRLVEMVVVPIVVRVGMLVLHVLVLVIVPVALEQMEEDSGGHQQPRARHEQAAGAIS